MPQCCERGADGDLQAPLHRIAMLSAISLLAATSGFMAGPMGRAPMAAMRPAAATQPQMMLSGAFASNVL